MLELGKPRGFSSRPFKTQMRKLRPSRELKRPESSSPLLAVELPLQPFLLTPGLTNELILTNQLHSVPLITVASFCPVISGA